MKNKIIRFKAKTLSTVALLLLAANPAKHEELGRIEAISGKTWNHPVVAHGRLYVRNDSQMAAFDVSQPGR